MDLILHLGGCQLRDRKQKGKDGLEMPGRGTNIKVDDEIDDAAGIRLSRKWENMKHIDEWNFRRKVSKTETGMQKVLGNLMDRLTDLI